MLLKKHGHDVGYLSEKGRLGAIGPRGSSYHGCETYEIWEIGESGRNTTFPYRYLRPFQKVVKITDAVRLEKPKDSLKISMWCLWLRTRVLK